jgi:hypothetical protein
MKDNKNMSVRIGDRRRVKYPTEVFGSDWSFKKVYDGKVGTVTDASRIYGGREKVILEFEPPTLGLEVVLDWTEAMDD